MPQEVAFIIGQALGVLVVIFGFLSFQMKTSARILIFQIIVAGLFALHYLFLGALTAVWLNLLAMVQCVVYYYRDRLGCRGRVIPILFSLSIILVSLLSWEGWHTLLIMIGLAINTLSLSFSRAQSIRIEAPEELLVNVDGEAMRSSALEMSVVPRGLNFIFPAKMAYFENENKEIEEIKR